MLLSFYETLHESVRRFHPPDGRAVRLYVCGPTVYDTAHVGHGRTYLYFDIVRRFLEVEGHRVRYVMNVTDFEDKITARATALGVPWRTLARREERRFFGDLDRLGLEPATAMPRASEYVPEMIRAIRRLEKLGYVERSGGTLVYAPPRDVCHRNFPVGHALGPHLVPEPGAPPPPEDGTASAFVLWRPQSAPAPSWPSPWGRGSPGWHLECYAMADKLLGLPVDLHGGGADLVFPHHFTENEVAMTLDGTLFSRSFLHLPFVTQDGRKMAKSTGNLVALSAALEEAGPDAVRWYLLGTSSRKRLDWTSKGFSQATARVGRVKSTLAAAIPDGSGGTLSVPELRRVRKGIHHDVADQIGVDRAIARIERYARKVESRADPRYPRGSRTEVVQELTAIDRLLGTQFAPSNGRATRARARRSG
ncbi:MAG: class I tRNA ligase family protein [Thermoplasmata archaeon]|nr:class I tRNA ligase family protein [Thermoplasmata archaeon]